MTEAWPSPPARRDGTSLSVVIPALNEERHIGSLLSDVAAQTRRADEIIVVDAGSEDGTVAALERFSGVVLLAGSPPVAAGRNLGGRSARGDVLTFLDADVRLSEGFFEGFSKSSRIDGWISRAPRTCPTARRRR